ncbi:MAG: hypothetical protein IID32_11995, partial [Planctomycetes bacterium]|nr:hypothetical protein [Planctomycetota bacterium]
VEVDGVEIDRNVLSLAHWFTKWNHDVLKKSNIQITVQDARNFIQWTPNRYDVITLEPMSPVQAGVANLYSREFYQNSRYRLTAQQTQIQSDLLTAPLDVARANLSESDFIQLYPGWIPDRFKKSGRSRIHLRPHRRGPAPADHRLFKIFLFPPDRWGSDHDQ